MFDRLEEAILTVPNTRRAAQNVHEWCQNRTSVPGHRPTSEPYATCGVLAELTFNNVGVANRVIGQEVSLSFLDPTQHEACLRYSQYRTLLRRRTQWQGADARYLVAARPSQPREQSAGASARKFGRRVAYAHQNGILGTLCASHLLELLRQDT